MTNMFAVIHSNREVQIRRSPAVGLQLNAMPVMLSLMREMDRLQEGIIAGIVVYEKQCMLLKVKVTN
jgi:hypothetical protein